MSSPRMIILSLSMLFMTTVNAAITSTDNGESLLYRADSLYRMGNFTKAVEMYLQAAEAGNAEAQFDIGYAYYTGEGTERDYTTAAMWFKRSAKQKFAKALYNLAYCYMNGRGVPRDYEKAYHLLLESAETNYKRAQLTLADCYARGILVEQNEEESTKWKNKAEQSQDNKIQNKIQDNKLQDANQQNKTQDTKQQNKTQKEKLSGDFSIEVDVPGMETNGQNAMLAKEEPAKMSAPTLRILYPEDQSLFHTDQIKLKYQLINNGCDDSTRIVVMVDGQRQPETRAVRAANTIDVSLPHHDCTIMMYAQNRCGNSEPATLRLIREATQYEMPKLFVVAIGVGDYNDPKLPKLKLTCKDAQDFAKAVATKKGLPYEDVQVKLLCDSEATRADIFEAMEWLKQESSPNDVCIFFYAGHGLRDEKDRFYFIPYGCHSDKLYDCFSAADFRNEAEDINGKFIAFVDACYSGALLEGTRSAATSHFIEQLKRSKNGMLLYASSSSDTKSCEDESWGNGAFTKALVESFNGAAKEENSEGLSTQELEHFLYKEVRKTTNYKQTPIFINPNGIEHFNIFNYDK